MLGRLRAFVVLFLFLTITCKVPEEIPRGGENQIILVCDDALEEAEYFNSIVNDTFHTPHRDPLFHIDYVVHEQFISYAGFKNVLIFSFPESPNYTFFKRIFGNVKEGVYKAKNVFRRGDFVVGVLAPKKQVLKKYVEDYSPVLKELFLERYFHFLRMKAYFTGRDKKKEKEIRKRYGISLKLPEGWQYWKTENNFLSLVKHYPDRFIFIYTSSAKPNLMPQNILDIRDSLAEIYYEGDKVIRSQIKIDTLEFLNENALRIIGPWANDTLVIGGGFISIAFNHNGKFYLLDGGIFAPERKEKLEYLLRAQIIFSTIKLE